MGSTRALRVLAAIASSIVLFGGERTALAQAFAVPSTHAQIGRAAVVYGPNATTIYVQATSTAGSRVATVVPIPKDVDVEISVSSPVIFAALGALTEVTVWPPPRNCPDTPPGCPASALPEPPPRARRPLPAPEGARPVAFERFSHIDPTGPRRWLESVGVPAQLDADRRRLDELAASGSDVVVLLDTAKPNGSAPVRLRARGVRPWMLGALQTSGITSAWVVGARRYEPVGIPTFAVRSEDLTWNWRRDSVDSVWSRRIESTLPRFQVGEWETVASVGVPSRALESTIRTGSPSGGSLRRAEDDYPSAQPVTLGAKSSEELRNDDLVALTEAVDGSGRARLTHYRGRADLYGPVGFELGADPSELGDRFPTKEQGEPMCQGYAFTPAQESEVDPCIIFGATCYVCRPMGAITRSKADVVAPYDPSRQSTDAGTGGSSWGYRCDIGAPKPALEPFGLGGLIVLGAALARRRRRSPT